MTFFASKKPPFVKTTSSNEKNRALFNSEVFQRISLIFDQNLKVSIDLTRFPTSTFSLKFVVE